MNIAVIPELEAPGEGGGPMKGMWALQEVLRRVIREWDLDWLTLCDRPRPGHVPWLWCYRSIVADLARQRVPFIMGPNVIFTYSRRPRIDETECAILDACSCEAVFCHSEWYRDLIRENMGPQNNASILCWPYPIRPMPEGPVANPTWDVLIFVKSGPEAEDIARVVARCFTSSVVTRYGEFRREELYSWARASRSCVYLSDDESGGLATQEIMLAGCPVVGIERGAPLVVHDRTGIRIDTWDVRSFVEGIERSWQLDRREVRAAAIKLFDEDKIASTVVGYLDAVRKKFS